MEKRRTSRTERAEELRLLHASGDDAWWGRPDAETVKAVWRLIAPTLPAKLKHLARDFTSRQALTVALARCVQVGGEPWKPKKRKRRTISRNHIFDAVAPKWSRTFKTIAEVGRPGLVPTPHVSDQRRDSAEEARRQLLAVGVRLADTWKIIAGDWSKKAGPNPLFYLTRPNTKLGYRVHLRNTEAVIEFTRLLPTANPHRSVKRLLLDTDPWPPRVDRYQVCAERPFNGVEEDETVLKVIETLEHTRLRFNAGRFKADYDRREQLVGKIRQWKQRVPFDRRGPFARRVRIARQLQTELDADRQVRQQAGALPSEVLIKSRFFRDQEGRFHARHFWPQHVSGRGDRSRRFTGMGLGEIPDVRFSRRSLWFADRHGSLLTGYDVASSQTQILAVLLGLTELEALTRDRHFKIKKYLAEQAITRLPMRKAPTSPAALVPMMKDIWTRILYGGHIKEIVWDYFEVLVLGTFTRAQYLNAVRAAAKHPKNTRMCARARRLNDTIKEAERNLTAFLEDIPWYGKAGEGKLSDFFRACQQVARTAMERDIYAGISFVDPLAQTTIRWNPPRRGRVRMNCQGFQVTLRLPGGWSGKRGTPQRRFIDAISHLDSGDYPVSQPKLTQAVAPGVIHLLDAHFNALVVRELARAGIVDFTALHDCWAAPTGSITHERAFSAAIKGAGREWLEGLSGIYATLIDYLKGTEFEPWLRRLRDQWEQRKHEERWPDFRVEREIGAEFPPMERLREGYLKRRSSEWLEELKSRASANVPHSGEGPRQQPGDTDVSSTKSAT